MKHYHRILIGVILLMTACNHVPRNQKLAKYVGDPANGLVKSIVADGKRVVCQLMPAQEKTSGPAYTFRVYLNDTEIRKDDSLMYYMNYRSAEMFSLVTRGDTLTPMLSERIANGRTDRHEFTLVFDRPQPSEGEESLNLLISKNMFLPQDLVFTYSHNDIIKASKNF